MGQRESSMKADPRHREVLSLQLGLADGKTRSVTSPFEKSKFTSGHRARIARKRSNCLPQCCNAVGFSGLGSSRHSIRSERSGKRHGKTNCETPAHAEEMCKVPSTKRKPWHGALLVNDFRGVSWWGRITDWAGCHLPDEAQAAHIGTFRTAHLVPAAAQTQVPVSLSSGEAETYGVTQAFSRATGMRDLANDLGFERHGELSLEVQTDSSAALAICQRLWFVVESVTWRLDASGSKQRCASKSVNQWTKVPGAKKYGRHLDKECQSTRPG